MSSQMMHIILYVLLISITYSQNYVLVQNVLSFDNAESKCLFDYEQYLASIHNANDQTEATSIALTHDAYIGMTDIVSEGTWVNVDGTAWDYGNIINPTGTFPWDIGEPSNFNGVEHCAHISYVGGGAWNDISCDTEFYFLCNYPGETTYIFNDPSWYSRTPSIGNQIGTIDVLDEFYIEFDFDVHSWPANNGFENIFHIGNVDNERYPAIYTYTGSGVHKIQSSFGVVTNWNPSHDSGAISSGTHHYEMRQTQDYLTVSIDGGAVYDGISDSHPIVFNQPIYLGNNFGTDAANVTISNLIMTTNNLHVPNHFYYTCDTVNRFRVIRGTWKIVDPDGIDPCWGLSQDIDTIYGGVVWLGDNDPSSLLWTDYTVEVDIKVTGANSAGNAGLLVRAQSVCDANDCGQQYWIGIELTANQVVMGIINNAWATIQAYDLSNIGYTIVTKQYYLLRVEVSGATFKVYFNNQHIFTETRSALEYSTGSVGLRTFQSSARFRYFRVIFPSDNELITVEPTTSPTFGPTTAQPTTFNPTTNNPTTFGPTTAQPTTSQPTTFNPTTNNPTTFGPTTYAPTTAAPITSTPTYNPSNMPTDNPTQSPLTSVQTWNPSKNPSNIPTLHPTISPSNNPSEYGQTKNPTYNPSINPSKIPTNNPSKAGGTYNPTNHPSISPTELPTGSPSDITMLPTKYPSASPTKCSQDLSLTNEGCTDDRCANSEDPYLDIRLSFSVCKKKPFVGRRYGLWNAAVNCLCYLSKNGNSFDYSNPITRRRLGRGDNKCNFNVFKYNMDVLTVPVSTNCNTTGFGFFFAIEGCGDCVMLTQSLKKIKDMETNDVHNAVKKCTNWYAKQVDTIGFDGVYDVELSIIDEFGEQCEIETNGVSNKCYNIFVVIIITLLFMIFI